MALEYSTNIYPKITQSCRKIYQTWSIWDIKTIPIGFPSTRNIAENSRRAGLGDDAFGHGEDLLPGPGGSVKNHWGDIVVEVTFSDRALEIIGWF